ncbi:MAG: single-stranded DNA-binding protein [Chloroflexi bacterium HGW-Chloroflexi-1]|nr:MAG: single-stranded DNA-binding protein [Chloroflexi bacterium HGW-Chloroflexi-1]
MSFAFLGLRCRHHTQPSRRDRPLPDGPHFHTRKEVVMASLNRVQLIGRLGRDPEVRYTSKGTPSTRFSLAVDRAWTNAEGERQTETDWFNIEAWGKLGEICQKYLRKGRLIYVEGPLRIDRWDDEKGEPQTFTKVVATNMQMLERKPEEPEVTDEE